MRKIAFLSFFLGLFGSVALADSNETFLYLSPQKNNRPKALFIFSPGANRKAEEYRDLMLQVQENSRLELAVAILRFKGTFPNSNENLNGVQSAIDFAKRSEELKDLGPRQVFLGGHSLGGVYAREDAIENNLGGLVLLGAYLVNDQTKPMSLSKYPLPVLTLGGERDGLTPITRIAKEWSLLNSENFLNKPVIEIPNLNHSLFASGRLQGGDFESPLAAPDAHRAIAKIVASFLDLQAGVDDGARAAILEGVRQTGTLVNGFLKAFKEDRELCEGSQGLVSNLQPKEFKKLRIVSTDEGNLYSFSLSKPKTIAGSDDKLEIRVFYYIPPIFNALDISKLAQSPREVAV